MAKKMQTMDGNQAAAYAGYAFTEVAGIYPITPSSPMAEYTDEWAARGIKNMFGVPVKVVEMQSEAGAAGTVHGSLQAGALTTTYTASQGLLLKIPNMYKIAGELLPSVIHVSARSLAAQALSIFGDHQDVYAAKQTGFAMLFESSVQEVMDLSGVAHLAAIKSRVPFMNIFDGFRTSHEIQKVELMDYEVFRNLVDMDAIKAFRNRALNPEHPVTKGTAQNDDIYFQTREVQNKYYDAVPAIVAEYMAEISKATGREYKPFNFYGHPEAEHIIIAMGSVCETLQETVDYLMAKGEKVGIINVHLYRPFSSEYFFNVFPKTVKKIAVLDRTKEPGALGEPLYMDIKGLFYGMDNAPVIVGGRYGLSSKDTTPAQMLAVFDNLKAETPKDGFVVGITDDVTFKSLEVGPHIDTTSDSVRECLFFGLGSDGTVGANKNSIKIIGDKTDLYAQGYFAYDSKKSGGSTRSHLRFGKEPIRSTYLVSAPNFVACSVPAYLTQYDMIGGLKKNGSFLLNCVWDKEEAVSNLPNSVKKSLAEKNAKFYIINANKLATEIGLGGRTNTIMQSAFFKLADVIPFEDAQKYMKDYAEKSYGNKGAEIVKMNFEAIDRGAGEIVEVTVDPAWANLTTEVESEESGCSCGGCSCTPLEKFVDKICKPINAMKGDSLPVSTFLEYADGTFENGTTAFEKRGVAVSVPEWKMENCIQCNQCSYVCPHAVIRPFLMTEEEKAASPNELKTKTPIGKGLEGLSYKIQVSPLDCTGCGLCANVCPAKEKALVMVPIAQEMEAGEQENADYLFNKVTYKDTLMPKNTVKGSQFAQPLFEFHGACGGCGETPYIKAITQLFGDRMMIANATGCSSIYGGSAPSTPYTTNACGEGPSWGNSLFEDNAEFGYGMSVAVGAMRDRIQHIMESNMESVSPEVKALFEEWIANKGNGEKTKEIKNKLVPMLEACDCEVAREILDLKQYLVKKSQWIFGGDGWAYDIGYGGLDHVLATSDDVNVLVMDTEIYSNTGGQASKSTQTGAVAKFAAAGKPNKKKDLAAISMSYGHIYVAQVSMGANQQQYLKAIAEAEAYPGPSIIIAYSPCISHGIKKGMGQSQQEMKLATECGYWPIFRYNPLLEKEGKNPLQIDSKEPQWDKYNDYLMGEVRYATLTKTHPEDSKVLFAKNKAEAQRRWRQYQRLASLDFSTEGTEAK
ncbi:MAG: pyruvate:ferredoxin (flavodoxin) oxidoreductase [Cetobacterium sp.]|uniref:pyruvate:ferredoxin (flavodoxin) oxidoreductase n=1 Tax=unclassified Cetobacterium TaxID=2630983 RepID=UPI00163CB129|nr:pyruvate:ferredoxin (flavodoxin) oxidoreductase [Cetobacterium sp. 2A]MBC2855823.1 pyruvate:ferredoxin (flavodoxin) oxidoreductase [Cetobacterium sp. 2A]